MLGKHISRLGGSFVELMELSLQAWEAYSEINLEYQNSACDKRWKHELPLARNLNFIPKMFHAFIRRMKN